MQSVTFSRCPSGGGTFTGSRLFCVFLKRVLNGLMTSLGSVSNDDGMSGASDSCPRAKLLAWALCHWRLMALKARS